MSVLVQPQVTNVFKGDPDFSDAVSLIQSQADQSKGGQIREVDEGSNIDEESKASIKEDPFSPDD